MIDADLQHLYRVELVVRGRLPAGVAHGKVFVHEYAAKLAAIDRSGDGLDDGHGPTLVRASDKTPVSSGLVQGRPGVSRLDPLQERFAVAGFEAAVETMYLSARRGLVESREDGVNQRCSCCPRELARDPERDTTVLSVGLPSGLRVIGQKTRQRHVSIVRNYRRKYLADLP